MGSLGEMLVSSWVSDTQAGDFAECQEIRRAKRPFYGTGTFDQWGIIGKNEEGEGPNRTKSMFLVFAKSRRWLRSGWWAEVSSLIHLPGHIRLSSPKKSIHQFHTSSMYFLAERQQRQWQPDCPWAPGIVTVLPASTRCPSPAPWPTAAIIILCRDSSGDKKQIKTNGQPFCGPVPKAGHQYIALPE